MLFSFSRRDREERERREGEEKRRREREAQLQKMREASEAKLKAEQEVRRERELRNLDAQLNQARAKKESLSSRLTESVAHHEAEVLLITQLDEQLEVCFLFFSSSSFFFVSFLTAFWFCVCVCVWSDAEQVVHWAESGHPPAATG